MTEIEFKNISELRLHRASVYISEGDFNKASESFLMVMLEFDEKADLYGFLVDHLNRLDKKNAKRLLAIILKDMSRRHYLNKLSNPLKKDKLDAFYNQSRKIFEEYGLDSKEQKARFTRSVLATLTPREEQVLRMRFGIGEKDDHTLEEVLRDFSVTQERIRQIEAKALRKLLHPSRAKKPRSSVED